jgi:hypothetical protein
MKIQYIFKDVIGVYSGWEVLSPTPFYNTERYLSLSLSLSLSYINTPISSTRSSNIKAKNICDGFF